MKISRENYEIWFIDWMENKLSGEQLDKLSIFLIENPDLKKEFDDLSELAIDPPSETFHWKGLLKRDPSEIPSGQFDLLCVANLEGDLDPDQLSEFSDIIAANPEKKRTAGLFALTKIIPPTEKYPLRKNLYRQTFSLALVRFALPAIGAAALLALLLMTGVLRKGIVPVEITNQAAAQYFEINRSAPVKARGDSPATAKSKPAEDKNPAGEPKRDVQSNSTSQENFTSSAEDMDISPVKIEPVLHFEYLKNALAEGPSYVLPLAEENDEERSRIGKFLARTFREKVLDEPTASDRPLKAYEIAEAGITGINKLLGWDMALTRDTDDNGKTSSVNFNSRLLKFNAPVKNNAPGE
jgi:hypothetical protein